MAKKMTLEVLARMIERGLEQNKKDILYEVKSEMKELASKGEFWELRHEMKSGFGEIREDFKEIKTILPPMLRSLGKMELEINELQRRLLKVERKVGLEK